MIEFLAAPEIHPVFAGLEYPAAKLVMAFLLLVFGTEFGLTVMARLSLFIRRSSSS